MLKYALFIVAVFFLARSAKCQKRDTTIVYVRNSSRGYFKVSTPDSADFTRVFLPPDSGDDRANLKEYYKDGKIKFIGKCEAPQFDRPASALNLDGTCINFYPNGKRQHQATFKNSEKVGFEYYYFPTGGIYSVIKYIDQGFPLYSKGFNWECYTTADVMICKEGNGHWIVYGENYRVVVQGDVKNGLFDGEWKGLTKGFGPDSIRYSYKFNNGKILSRTGYDIQGIAHPFTDTMQMANYRGGPIAFVKAFKNHLTIPVDSNGKKMSVDTVHISFIVEKDGRTDQFKTIGNLNPVLTSALADAMIKCPDWMPGLFYGIPVRTKVVLPLAFVHGYGVWKDPFYQERMLFGEKVLGF